ncbi:MAG: inositol monophosphatase [Deltaproteobacteria bacterium]|nr:inositol monophosphatase [Deltaproteobacteria bacterium]
MPAKAIPASALLAAAKEAAQAGAKVLSKGYGRPMMIGRKGIDDPVTKFDLGSERAAVKIIAGRFPEHSILAEEGGPYGGAASKYRWYLDPLDGTVNFTRGRGDFCVSVACALYDPPHPPKVLAAAVLAPALRELWSASLGGGAWLESESLIKGQGLKRKRISLKPKAGNSEEPRSLSEALAVVGFPYGFHEDAEAVLKPVVRVAKEIGTMRQSGSAALDICAVAAGRADAFFEEDLKPWDVAAGMLLASEAGALVTDWSGQPYVLEESKTLLASSPHFSEDLARLLKSWPSGS